VNHDKSLYSGLLILSSGIKKPWRRAPFRVLSTSKNDVVYLLSDAMSPSKCIGDLAFYSVVEYEHLSLLLKNNVAKSIAELKSDK